MSPYIVGVRWGNIWAGQTGVDDALSSLLALSVALDVDEWCQWFVGADHAQAACQRILHVFRPQAPNHQSEVDAFWSFLPDNSSTKAMLLHPDFVLGFADGALEVWNKNQMPQSAQRAP
jgi:hypothetical protein